MSHVKIEMTGTHSGRVWIDGQELDHVVSVKFGVSLDDKTNGHSQVEIVQRVIGTVEIEGQMDVTVLDNDGSRKYAKADAKQVG